MNDAILKTTQELGQLLRESKEFEAMQKEEESALLDQELQGLYREYSLCRQNMQQEEMETEPDHGAIDALQMEIDRLQAELSQSDSLSTLNHAREGFSKLMQEVNSILEATLNPQDELEDSAEGCGPGGCAGCSGCGNSR